MIIERMEDLTPVKQRAIIINHNTKDVALLALLSTLRFAGVPVLLIDCDSSDGSFDFFKHKMDHHNFDLLQLPLKTHGLTLDLIFTETKDEQLLLVDSDVEILNGEIFKEVNKDIEKKSVYGCGFVVEKTNDFQGRAKNAVQMERMFIPFVLLKTAYIKTALSNGISFNAEWTRKHISFEKRMIRKFLPGLLYKNLYSQVVYDTGAKMHEYLTGNCFKFIGRSHTQHEKYFTHFMGATRHVLNPAGRLKGDMKTMPGVVKERLSFYGY